MLLSVIPQSSYWLFVSVAEGCSLLTDYSFYEEIVRSLGLASESQGHKILSEVSWVLSFTVLMEIEMYQGYHNLLEKTASK